MFDIPRLDIMIAYACNIKCQGCISLSNFQRKGVESLFNLSKSVDTWKNLLNPKVITLFGGEPTLHPKLPQVITKINQSWPNSIIRLITNGYLLDRFDPLLWFNFKNFELQISLHRQDHKELIRSKVMKIIQCKNDWHVIEPPKIKHHKQWTWKSKNIAIYFSMFSDFVMPYKLSDHKIESWHSDPTQAHKICGAPNTPILYKNKLYKCPPIANIQDMTNGKFSNYHGYCVDDDIQEFVNNIGRPEKICGNCPDIVTDETTINHFKKETVYVKNIS